MPNVDVTNDILANFAKFLRGVDGDDPEFQREVMRPAVIKEDVRLMEQRKRVSLILQSAAFRKHLDVIISSQISTTLSPPSCHPGLGSPSKVLSPPGVASHTSTLATSPTSERRGVVPSAAGQVPFINDIRESSFNCNDNEVQNRCKLASLYRVVDFMGWANSVYKHISLRCSGRNKEEFLINSFGIPHHYVTSSGLLKVDLKGNNLQPENDNFELDEIGWKLHSAVYAANAKIRCIIHLDTPATVAVSLGASNLLPLCQEAILVGPAAFIDSYHSSSAHGDGHQTESLIGSLDGSAVEAYQLHQLKTLLSSAEPPHDGEYPHVIFLKGRGLLALGGSVEEAWFYAYNSVQACEYQLTLSHLTVDDLWLPSAQECAALRESVLANVQLTNTQPGSPHTPKSTKSFDSTTPPEWSLGEIEFEAFMRHFDNAGWRTGYPYRVGGQSFKVTTAADDTIKSRGTLKKVSSPKKSRQDVEIPALVVASDLTATRPKLSKPVPPYWMISPNQYSRFERCDSGGEEDGDEEHSGGEEAIHSGDDAAAPPASEASRSKKSKRVGMWLPKNQMSVPLKSATLPTPSSTEAPNKYAPQGQNPKEFKEIQRQVKDKYYQDVNTSGPRSRLVEGLTLDELMRLKSEGMAKTSRDGTTLIRMATASRAIIEKEHRHETAYLTASMITGNPFEQITDDDLDRYKQEIEIKNNPELARLIAEEEMRQTLERQLLEKQKQETAAQLAAAAVREREIGRTSTPTSTVQRHATFQDDPKYGSATTDDAITPIKASSVARSPSGSQSKPGTSSTLPTSARLAALKSDTSGAEGSYDETEKEGTDTGAKADGKEKKKKRRFKMPSFSRKKKEKDTDKHK